MAYQGKFSRKSSANHLYHECKGNMYVIRNSTGFSRGNIEFYPLKYFKIKFDSKRRPRSPRLPRWWYPRHSLGLAFWSCLSAGVIYLRCDTATLDTQFGPFGQACMYTSLSPQPGSVPACTCPCHPSQEASLHLQRSDETDLAFVTVHEA